MPCWEFPKQQLQWVRYLHQWQAQQRGGISRMSGLSSGYVLGIRENVAEVSAADGDRADRCLVLQKVSHWYVPSIGRADRVQLMPCRQRPRDFWSRDNYAVRLSVPPEGSYLPKGAEVCQKCPKGMSCKVGSAMKNFDVQPAEVKAGAVGADGEFPTLLPRYWSHPAKPLSVFLCLNEKLCPGGIPSACADGREDSIMCANCASG